MKAHFTEHAFERHSHETFSIGLTHTGVQTFHCAGALHASLPGDLILFNPDAAHDGQRGTPEGFGYSILYVPESVVAGATDPDAGLHLPRRFRQPVAQDPGAARLYTRVLDAIAQPRETLRTEICMRELLIALLQRHGEAGPRALHATHPGAARLQRVRDHLEAHYAEDLTVQELAQVAGLSRAHLTRAFTQHFGVPPHIHLNTVRIRRAQAAMLRGEALAEVAVSCGFADQAHFSRRFKGAVGATPAQWLRQLRA
jgi:AraC-like DNA-binding protein